MKIKKSYARILGISMIFFTLFGLLGSNFTNINTLKNQHTPRDNLEIKDYEAGVDYGGIVTLDSEGYNVLYTWGNNQYGSLGRTTTDDYDPNPGIVEFKTSSGVVMDHSEYTIEELWFTESTSFALLTYSSDNSSHLYGWGRNDHCQLGLNTDPGLYVDAPYHFSSTLSTPGSILSQGGSVIDIVGTDTMSTIALESVSGTCSVLSAGYDSLSRGLFGIVENDQANFWVTPFSNIESGDKITNITLTDFSASVILQKNPSNIADGELDTELWVWGYEGGNNIGTLLPPTTSHDGNLNPVNIATTDYFPELSNSNAEIKKYISNPWTSIAVISPGTGESDIIRTAGTSYSANFTSSITYFPTNNISSNFAALEPSRGSTVESISMTNNIDGTNNSEEFGKPTLLISVIDGVSGENLVYTWGRNTNGLFGSGETDETKILGGTSGDSPNEISSLFPYYNETTRFTNVGITRTFGYAFATTDGVNYSYTWGENTKGQFGNGTTNSSIVPTPQLTIPEATFEVTYSNVTNNSLQVNFEVYFETIDEATSFDSLELSGTGIDNVIKNYTINLDQGEITNFETNKYGYTGNIQVSDLSSFTTYDDWFLTLDWTSPVSFLGAQNSIYKIPSISTIKGTPIVDNVTVTNIGYDSVDISWNVVDTDNAITSMVLTHPGVGTGSTDISSLNQSTINGLSSDTTYSDWSIDYIYDIGDGTGSIPISIDIPSFKTTSVIPVLSNIQTTNITQNSVDISWELTDVDSSITSMVLTHPGVGTGSTDISGLSNITIDGLSSNTIYSDWTINGTYDLSDGAGDIPISASIPSFTTLKNAPTLSNIQTTNITQNSVDISWELTDVDSSITSMVLTHPGVGTGSTDISGLSNITIDGLSSNTIYSDWTINGTYDLSDGAGDIPISASIPSFTTLKNAPTLSNIQTTNITQNSVIVSWELIDTDSAITSMNLNHPGVGIGSTDISDLSNITIDGLTSNTTYSDWTINGTYDLNNGEQTFHQDLIDQTFTTDYLINSVDNITAGNEIVIDLNIDGTLDSFSDDQLKVETIFEDEFGESYSYESSIDRTSKSISIDNTDLKFNKGVNYTLTRINYDFDSSSYLYGLNTDNSFLIESTPSSFNIDSISFDSSATDGTFLMSIEIIDADNLYSNENIFLRDNNNIAYEGTFISQNKESGTYVFKFNTDFGTYYFNGISFNGTAFQDFDSEIEVTLSPPPVEIVDNTELYRSYVSYIILVLIILLLFVLLISRKNN